MLSSVSPVTQELYGIRVRTPWPVPNVSFDAREPWDVEFLEARPDVFKEAVTHVPAWQAEWYSQNAALPDGSRYCCWTGLFQFIVRPDGRQIDVGVFEDASIESLQACLLVDALSFSMIRLGREPLHATAVFTDEGVVAFLGRSGLGKSTLGGLFVSNGWRLLADDMLVLTPDGEGFLAYPGPPRIKLYRDNALSIFGDTFSGVPMNPLTDKLIIPLGEAETRPVPLRALYILGGEHEQISGETPAIRRLSPAEAFPRLLASCATHWTYEPDRLKRQFAFITRLSKRAAIKTLSYVRDPAKMSVVRDAVLADLAESIRECAPRSC